MDLGSLLPIADRYWFAFVEGDLLGPLTPAQLHVLVERGCITLHTPVKHDRMQRYVPACEVIGLLPPAAPAPMPGPEPARPRTAEQRHTQGHRLLLVVALLGWACVLVVILARPA